MDPEVHLKNPRLCLKRKSKTNIDNLSSDNDLSNVCRYKKPLIIDITSDDDNPADILESEKQCYLELTCSYCEIDMSNWSIQRKKLHKTACGVKNNPKIIPKSKNISQTNSKNLKGNSKEKTKKLTKREPKLKTIINKAIDEELQTALALSKSLVDEDKRSNTQKKLDEKEPLPLKLTIESEKRQSILAERLNRFILTEDSAGQSPVSTLSLKLHSDNSDKGSVGSSRSWWSLCAYKLCPDDSGDVGENIDCSHPFYVKCLNPPIVPTTVREGDKVFSLSQVPGREPVELPFSQKNQSDHPDCVPLTQGFFIESNYGEETSVIWEDTENLLDERETMSDVALPSGNCKIFNNSVGCNTTSAPHNDQASQTTDYVTEARTAEATNCLSFCTFQSMVNNPAASDLQFILDSGEKIFAHKFIFAAWKLDPDEFMISSHSVSEVQLSGHRKQDVLLVLRYLYGGESPPARVHINQILRRFQLKLSGRSSESNSSKSFQPFLLPQDDDSSPLSVDVIENEPLIIHSTMVSTPRPQSLIQEIQHQETPLKSFLNEPQPISPSGSDFDMFGDYDRYPSSHNSAVICSENVSQNKPTVDGNQNLSWCDDSLKEEDLACIMDCQSPNKLICSENNPHNSRYSDPFQDSLVFNTQVEKCSNPNRLTSEPTLKFVDLTQDDTIGDESKVDHSLLSNNTPGGLKRERSYSSFLSPNASTPKRYSIAKTDSPIGLLATPPKTFTRDPSKWTPMPNYASMVTPELKKMLSNFGVRPLPKKKAMVLLKEIYRYTHEGENTETLSQPAVSSLTQEASPSSSIADVSTSNDEDNNSDGPIEESLLLSDDDSDTLRAQITQQVDYKEAIRLFIRNDSNLYHRILAYEPLDLKELHSAVKNAGIKVNMKKFMDFLDEECITFRLPKRQRHKPKPQTKMKVGSQLLTQS